MAPKTIAPSFAARSFTCPHCGALANQAWFEVRADASSGDGPVLFDDEIFERMKSHTGFKNEEERAIHERWCTYADRARTGAVFLWKMSQSRYDDYEVANIHISQCFSCRETTIWKHKAILHPTARFEVESNADLPEDIRLDFDEARTILDLSPRGAAALLRLCIQKLCRHLGKSGRSIDADIASLVKDGLDVRVQRALDIVRVIGNESVHPGTIDMKDNREVAAKLFELVNRIAYDRITHPKEIDALFASLPADKLHAIAKRDAPEGNAA
jgi:hypothetical protein